MGDIPTIEREMLVDQAETALALLPPEDITETDDEQRYVILGDDVVPYRSYRSQFYQAWRESISGFQVDENMKTQAYSVSGAAFACSQYRALTVSQIPIHVTDPGKIPVVWCPIDGFMPYMPKLFWYIEMSLLIWGVAYLRKQYNEWGYPTSLEWLHPEDVTPQEDMYHEVYEYYVMPHGDVLSRNKMVEIRRFDPMRNLDGKSEYEVAMARITTERNLVTHAGAFFFNSARPDGILVSKTKMNKDDREKAKKDWDSFKGSKNAWKTFVSGGDWEWIPITVSPSDLNMGELKDDLRRDICAIFRTHGALVGLASVSDPLSAGSTLSTIKRNHIESTTVPEFDDIAHELNTQWLWTDFLDTNYWTLAINKAAMPILSDVTTELSQVSVSLTAPTSPVLDYNEARAIMNMPPREDYLARSPDHPMKLYNEQGSTLNQARKLMGLEPLPVDIFKLMDGRLVRATDINRVLDANIKAIEAGQAQPTSQQPQLMQLVGGNTQQSAPEPTVPKVSFKLKPQPMLAKIGLRSSIGCSAILSLADDPVLSAIQTLLKSQVGTKGDEAVWIDCCDFHVTLIDIPVISQTDEAQLYPLIYNLKAVDLTLKGVGVFNTPTADVVYVEVEVPDEIVQLQRSLFDKARSLGILFSNDHFDPGKWTPHVTMCYGTPGVYTPVVDDYNLTVKPSAVEFTHSDYTPVFSKELPAVVRAAPVPIDVGVDLTEHNFVRTAQRVAASLIGNDYPVNWFDPTQYRMPIVTVPEVSSHAMSRVAYDISPQGLSKFAIRMKDYCIRSGIVCATIEPSDDLRNLCGALCDMLDSYGAEPIEDVVIPLGTVQQDIPDKNLGATDGYTIVVNNLALYNGLTRKASWKIRSHHPAFRKELDNWQKKVARKGRIADFIVTLIDPFTESLIRSLLTDTDISIDDVFIRAADVAENGLTYDQPDVLPTPEEYADYWRHFDELEADLAHDWVSYMDRAKPDIHTWMKSETIPGSALAVFAQHHDQLLSDWVGTPDKPGALYSLMLAGMAAGNEQLIRQVDPNPATRAAKATKLGLDISWDLLSQQAYDYARSYFYGLIKGIDQTTNDRLQRVFGEWVKSGKPFDDLANAIDVIIHDPTRSASIAQTEGIRVYNEGAFKRWQDVGVKKAKWRTVQDGLVCKICRPLNGQVADIQSGWTDPNTGKVYRSSAHTGCRCFRTPVTDDLKEKGVPVPAQPISNTTPNLMHMDIKSNISDEKLKALSGMTKEDILRMSGAYNVPNGNEDPIISLEAKTYRDGTLQKITVVINNDIVDIKQRLYFSEGKPDFIELDSLSVNKEYSGKGLGSSILAEQVNTASAQGFTKMTTLAAKGDGLNGYYTWARLGFDAELDKSTISTLPDNLKSAMRVSDLIKTEEGRAWWKDNGKQMDMSFDLTPDSTPMQVLSAYVEAKRNKPTEPVKEFTPPTSQQLDAFRVDWKSNFATAPQESKNILNAYTDIAFRNTNFYMRGQLDQMYDTDTGDPLPITDEVKEQQQRIIDTISNTLKPTTTDLITYRGMQDVSSVLNIDPSDLNASIGKTFEDKAFTSTSLNSKIAEGFASSNNAAVIEVRVPAGTKVAYLDPISQFAGGSVTKEEEVLLDRNLKYRIVDIVPQKKGWMVTYKIVVEIIP